MQYNIKRARNTNKKVQLSIFSLNFSKFRSLRMLHPLNGINTFDVLEVMIGEMVQTFCITKGNKMYYKVGQVLKWGRYFKTG